MTYHKGKTSYGIDFSNPVLVYAIVWGGTLFLYSLEFTNNIRGLNESALLLVLSTIVCFMAVFSAIYITRISFQNYKLKIGQSIKDRNSVDHVKKFKNILGIIFKFWLVISTIEIILFKGLPLTSVVVLGNYDLDYKAFGIPTIHGLLNSCYFTIIAGYFIHYRLTKEKASMWKVVILLFWPILVMSRAVLLWALMEILCVYFLFNRVNFKRVIFITVFLIGFIILFGVLGDNRGNQDTNRFSTDNFISDQYRETGEKLPSGFVWIYLYMTTPINNLVLNIDNLDPKFNFKYSLVGLIPSFIRDRIFTENDKYSLALDDNAFNVSSFFANYLSDFGIVGAVIFVSVLQIIASILFFSAKSGKIGSAIGYSAMFYAVCTSVFSDNFISLVTIFQVFLGLFINSYIYTKSRKTYVSG